MTDVQYGIVVKTHPDGYKYVLFDYDPSEEAAFHRTVIMGHLVASGHVLEHVHDTHSHHVILRSGPLA